MEFSILGDIEVRHDGTVVPLRTKQRLVLAVLLYFANRVVSRNQLIDLAWGTHLDDRPRTVNDLVTDYVSHLRRTFRTPNPTEIRLVAQTPGFVLRIDPRRIDWFQFESLLRQARCAKDTDDTAVTAKLLRAALELWHGPAMADAGKHLLPIREEMEARRLEAAEMLADIELRDGEVDRVLPLLAELGWRHPGRERLIAQLVRALHLTGRRSEAVKVYRRSQRHFIDQGLDPSEAIEAAYQAVLQSRPGTAPAADGAPAQLPPDTSSFTGRTTELARLLALAPARTSPTTVATVCVIHGMAGVGKTALAVHAAHQLAPRFPDGQVSLDLQGYSEGALRVAPMEALDRLLRKLGVDANKIPQHLDDRAGLYRGQLAGKRMLILLDNAHSTDQVRPLIPASAGCLVLVTARSRMVALDEGPVISLDSMPVADAAMLFERIVGPERLARERAVVEHIVEMCGGLPLAVRIVAARLRSHPAWPPSQMVGWLSEATERLGELSDGERSIDGLFRLSTADLGTDQQRLFRLLGLVPGRDIDTYAAAALFGAPVGRAARLLQELFDAHLLDQQVEGRYGLHDMMRHYASHCARDLESPENRQGAVLRWLEHQVDTAAAATIMLFPDDEDRRVAGLSPGTSVFSVATPPLARGWLDAERRNLIAAAAQAVEHGRPDCAWALDAVLYRYLMNGAHYTDALELHEIALSAARQIENPAAEGLVLRHLGTTHRQRRQYDEALTYLERALSTQEAIADVTGQAETLSELGALFGQNGRYEQAREFLERALVLNQRAGNAGHEATTLGNLAILHGMLGDYEVALRQHRKSLAICVAIGDQSKEASVLSNLGVVFFTNGDYAEAIAHYQHALEIFTDIGDRAKEATALSNLGEVHAACGDIDLAVAEHEHALSIFRSVRNRAGEGRTQYYLAATYAARGRADRAAPLYRAARDIAREIGDRYEQARALEGLASLLAADGRAEHAAQHLLAAYELYSELGVPEAGVIAARLGRDSDETE
jgi:tetratricopeptide (TPR) repeat protein/DNA-binding SARP family transcriptional activator